MGGCCDRIRMFTDLFENGYKDDIVGNKIHVNYGGHVSYRKDIEKYESEDLDHLHFRYCPYCGFEFKE
jgi:hypothetical protein